MAERQAANAKADQANQARMAARAQSEMRRTQQLKIIEGARAKVQSVIDARAYSRPDLSLRVTFGPFVNFCILRVGFPAFNAAF